MTEYIVTVEYYITTDYTEAEAKTRLTELLAQHGNLNDADVTGWDIAAIEEAHD